MEDYELEFDERNAPPPQRRIGPPVRVMTRPWPQQQQMQRPYYAAPPAYYRPPQRPVVIVQRQPSLLAGLDFGSIIEQGVTLLAAMQPLPDAPPITGSANKDVGNMILYQESLSDHAKSDERVRAFGGVVAKVVSVLLKNAQQRGGIGL